MHIYICNEQINHGKFETQKPQIQPPLETPLPVIHSVIASILIRNSNLMHAIVVLTLNICGMKLYSHLHILDGVINVSVFCQLHQFFRGPR